MTPQTDKTPRHRGKGDEQLRRHAKKLVDDVTERIVKKKNTGDRAALRRAMGRAPEHPTVRAAHAIVAPHLPKERGAATERAFYTVAALIAAQPRGARDGDLPDDNADAEPVPETSSAQPETTDTDTTGATDPSDSSEPDDSEPGETSLGRTLAEAVIADKLKPETTEARLHLLCRQGVDGLHRHLPRLISRLRSDLVPVDWATLVVDLSHWDRKRDQIAKAWLQDYYRTYHRATARKNENSDTPAESEDQ